MSRKVYACEAEVPRGMVDLRHLSLDRTADPTRLKQWTTRRTIAPHKRE